MFSLLFLVEKAGETQQSCWDSFGQADPPSEGMGLQALFMPPRWDLVLSSICPPKRNILKKVTVTTPVLAVLDLHSRQAERTATVNVQYKEHCIMLHSVLCHVRLTDRGSQFVYSVVTQPFYITSFSEGHCTLSLLVVAYEKNGGEDEHFIISKISSRDGQLGKGTRTQKHTRRVTGSALTTPAIIPHQRQWKYKAIKMEKRHTNRGKMKNRSYKTVWQ